MSPRAKCHPSRKHHSNGLCDSCRHKKRKGTRKRLFLRYGLDVGEYIKLLHKHNWQCAICETEQPKKAQTAKVRLRIDHDHQNGKVRGLLCARCNSGLGMFKDDTRLLTRAVDYLAKARCGI